MQRGPEFVTFSRVKIYLAMLAVLMVGCIAPSFARWDSLARMVRLLLMVAVYPLFVVMAITHGIRLAGLTWITMAGFALVLELIAEAIAAPAERDSLLRTLRNAALLWPLTIPATIESFLIRLGLAEAAPPIELPEPPRGSALFELSDDDMLIGVHQILSAGGELSAHERTILIAESFNREVHGGGFVQWFSNTDSSVADTARALRDVGAKESAALLERAAEAAPTARGPFDDAFYALESDKEDLTSLIARYVRKNRSHCPGLQAAR